MRCLAFTTLLIATSAHAYGVGSSVVGNSGKIPAQVCNSCHVGPAAPTNMVLKGPTTLTAGMTAAYTLTLGISGAPAATDAGLDIAASDPDAKLAPVTTGVLAVGGELVHQAPLSLAGGGGGGGGKSVTISFNVTAPPTNGTLTLYADGVIGDGLDAVASSRGATTTFAIIVTGGVTPSVDLGSSNSSAGDMSKPGGPAANAPDDMSKPNGQVADTAGDMAASTTSLTSNSVMGGCSVAVGGANETATGVAVLLLALLSLALLRRRARPERASVQRRDCGGRLARP
jgi:MYXO-CTERM domain-containing protein